MIGAALIELEPVLGVKPACGLLGRSRATHYRALHPLVERLKRPRASPPNAATMCSVARFSRALDLGRTDPDRGWDLVPMILEVLALQPALSSLEIVSVGAGTGQGVTASFGTLEEARVWAQMHDHKHLTHFEAEWSWESSSRTLLLAITTISAFVHVWSDSQVEAEGMPRLLAEAAALPPSFNHAAKLSRDRSTHRALDADHQTFSSSASVASPRRRVPKFLRIDHTSEAVGRVGTASTVLDGDAVSVSELPS